MSILNIRECTICQQSINPAHQTFERSSNCRHVFHKDCIVQWLSESQNCPNCREVWNGSPYPSALGSIYSLLDKIKKISNEALEYLKEEWIKARADCAAVVKQFIDYEFKSDCLKVSIRSLYLISLIFARSHYERLFFFSFPWLMFATCKATDRHLEESTASMVKGFFLFSFLGLAYLMEEKS